MTESLSIVYEIDCQGEEHSTVLKKVTFEELNEWVKNTIARGRFFKIMRVVKGDRENCLHVKNGGHFQKAINC